MGNTSSSQNRQTAPDTPHRSHSRRSRSQHLGTQTQNQEQNRSPSRASTDAQSQSTQKKLPHRSLRQKKKSLELPDLALALTSAPSGVNSGSSVPGGPYRRPTASAPIAIPNRNGAQASTSSSAAAAAKAAYEQRLKSIPTAEASSNNADAFFQGYSTGRGRGNSLFRGAPIQYNSTRSFTGTSRGQPQFQSFGLRGTGPDQDQDQEQEVEDDNGTFKAEDVHSSIPLALRKAEQRGKDESDEDGAQADESGLEEEKEDADGSIKNTGAVGAPRKTSEEKHPVQVCIVWRGGGKSVLLMRAGDDNWKGRQPMDYDESTKQWTTWVSLMPGTHHIRFLVDGVSKIAEDLPTAVDDNGTLANYVAVPISGHTPPSATLHPASRDALHQYEQAERQQQQQQGTPLLGTTPAVPAPGNGVSFFADAEAAAGKEIGAWTDKVPWQLECAAEEEEQWLSYSNHPDGSQGHGPGGNHPPPPPQHPQAPSLPRHLEKLIMNQKMPSSRNNNSSSSKSNPKSGTHTNTITMLSGSELPVTTASGTNLSASTSAGGALGMTSSTSGVGSNSFGSNAYGGSGVGGLLSDDNSVLPVPSHVVLHHLGTSAIRNGVLAVADTVRYKKKYITTIYYKPT